MKKILFILVLLVVFGTTQAQNAFPTTGNVGIGTTLPSAKLEIANAGTASLRVGITSNRANTYTQLLNSSVVVGINNSTSAVNGAVAWNFYNDGVAPSWSGVLLEHFGTAMTGTQYGLPTANQGTLVFQNVSNAVIGSNGMTNISISPFGKVSTTFLSNGNVIIGTVTAPNPTAYKLYVQTGILTEKVKVAVATSSQWADYVFAKDYKLMPLSDVEQFVKANNHLPNVLSATEMVKEGNDLGATDAKLLEKIEELTLYMIEMKKINEVQNDLHKKEIEILKEEILNLKK